VGFFERNRTALVDPGIDPARLLSWADLRALPAIEVTQDASGDHNHADPFREQRCS
jgi:hypothetical protein